jgi:hypothetical protein
MPDYGPGATFTDAAHWQINYNGGTAHEIITFSNAASIHGATSFLCERETGYPQLVCLAPNRTVEIGRFGRATAK